MAYLYTNFFYNLIVLWIFFVFVAALKAKTKLVKRVPKGTSEYQAAWIVDSEEEEVQSCICRICDRILALITILKTSN